MNQKYFPLSCDYLKGLLCCNFLIMEAMRYFFPCKFCFIFESTTFKNNMSLYIVLKIFILYLKSYFT